MRTQIRMQRGMFHFFLDQIQTQTHPGVNPGRKAHRAPPVPEVSVSVSVSVGVDEFGWSVG